MIENSPNPIDYLGHADPAESDRRSYLDSKLSGAKPSFGHLALATLMQAQLTKMVWTTNFDSLVADAAAKVYDSTGPLSTIDLDAPELAAQLIGDGRWPIEIKLHGDFRSRRLKNTDDELRLQDAKLHKVLVDSCRRFGLDVSDQTVGNILKDHGIEPAPDRKTQTSWSTFLKAHWDVLGAIDFTTVEVWTKGGLVTFYLLFAMDDGTLRWIVVDSIHHWTGIRQPDWDFSQLHEKVTGFDVLVES